MIDGEDTKRINRICKEAMVYIMAIADNCNNLHWSYLAEKTEKAQSCIDVLRGYYKEYKDAQEKMYVE